MAGKSWVWLLAFFLLIAIAASGCAPARINPYERAPQKALPHESSSEKSSSHTLNETLSSEKPQIPKREKAPSDPRLLASVQLTDQGRTLLEQGRVDEAIAVFEQALNVSPDNGRNYYYLAEAWLAKDELGQALEWNRLADLYLKNDPDWANKVHRQKARIDGRK